MNVSLCGPHSFETSTLVPALTPGCPVHVSGPWAARNWYFAHHVGLSELLVCAAAGAAANIAAPASTAQVETNFIRTSSKGSAANYTTRAWPSSPAISNAIAMAAFAVSATTAPARNATAPARTIAADHGYAQARKGRGAAGSRRRSTT